MEDNWVWGIYGSPVCLPHVRQTVVWITPPSSTREELEEMAGLSGMEIEFGSDEDMEF